MTIVQILGNNGSGKSTIFKTIAKLGAGVMSDAAPGLTRVPSLGGVMLGDYMPDGRKTPGCDAIGGGGGKAGILAGLDAALGMVRISKGTWVGLEGIIIMTRQYHHEYLARGVDRVVYVELQAPLDLCFQRIEERNGKRREDLKGNGERVVVRAPSIVALCKWLEQQPKAEMVRMDSSKSKRILAEDVLRLVGLRIRTPI